MEQESTTDLIKTLIDDAQALVRDEVLLAKLELARQVEKGKAAGTAIGAGAVVGFVTLMLFAFTLVAALSLVVAPWLAGAIVTLVFGAAAGIAILKGVKTFKQFEPSRALDHMKEEAQWIKKTVHDIQSHKRENTLH